MYGSIRKSYGAKKASCDAEKKERKLFFGKKKKIEETAQEEFQETSYINVENSNKEIKNTKSRSFGHDFFSNKNEQNNSNANKSEFPIASVILTIVFTMMVMVAAFGFGGI